MSLATAPLEVVIEKLNAAAEEGSDDLAWASQLADELLALSSIYDEEAISLLPTPLNGGHVGASDQRASRPGTPSLREASPEDADTQLALARSWSPGMRLRLSFKTRLETSIRTSSMHEDEPVELRVAATLPARYPDTENPPQLQLLNRFVGGHAVDHVLFGKVLRCLLHDREMLAEKGRSIGMEWRQGESVLFEALDWVKETVTDWYEGRQKELQERTIAQELARNNARSQQAIAGAEGSSHTGVTDFHADAEHAGAPRHGTAAMSPKELADLAKRLSLVSAEPIIERKSTFIGHCCRLESPDQVPLILEHLRSDNKIARATHPTIHAYTCTTSDGITHHDCDDDGESAAGGRLAHLLQILVSRCDAGLFACLHALTALLPECRTSTTSWSS